MVRRSGLRKRHNSRVLVCQSFPFANTGVDYAGPFLVKQIYNNTVDPEMYSVHIVLYTCATTRAVHLDLVPDTTAASFIRSLKRFIGRRGVPRLMLSDNATCFRSEEVRLSEELLVMGVEWRFIVPAAPWWGGMYERLIRSMKRSLNRIIFRASVTFEELLTVITEIEAVMNSRPLTYVNDDVTEVLTPGHLLIGKRILESNYSPAFECDGNDRVRLTNRAKYMKTINEHYWTRWRNEYLVELRCAHTQGNNESVIRVG